MKIYNIEVPNKATKKDDGEYQRFEYPSGIQDR